MFDRLKARIDKAVQDVVYSQLKEATTPDEINRIAQEYNIEISEPEMNYLLDRKFNEIDEAADKEADKPE